MRKFSRSAVTFYSALTLVNALVLTPLPVVHSRESLPPALPVREQAQAQEQSAQGQNETQEAEDSANQAKAKDPCKHKEKDGKKPKKKQCLPEQRSGGVAKGDFNGDGFGDLAVGVPNEDVGTIADAGAVNVLYGSARGLTVTNNQFWTEDSPGIVGTSEAGDQFGSSLASGDFNGDGFSDLAIGVPEEDGVAVDQGAVHVIFGSATGLTATGNQAWAQNSTGILDDAEENDEFGGSLVWGDFNHDGFGDLAVGVTGESVGGIGLAGAVNVIYGSPSGLTATNNQFWTQDLVLGGAALGTELFGLALAAGDFDRDGNDDLAIGVPFQTVGLAAGAGEVDILYGSAGVGLNSARSQAWNQNSAGIPDTAETADFFGFSLAVGDFSGDGAADLAVGVPAEDVGTIADAGAVNVIYGSAGGGLTAIKSQFWTQDSSGILDACEADDHFGLALAAGDFNGDGAKDLAVGVPEEDLGTIADAGAVNVLYGSFHFVFPATIVGGLVSTNNQFFTQDTSGVSDTAEQGDNFGRALTAWNFGFGPEADLAIGVPFEDLGTIKDAGAVNVLYGSPDRLETLTEQFWHQDVPTVLDQAEAGDGFGSALY